MSPNLRRACHQALDLVLDALAEDAAAPTRARSRPTPRAELPANVTDATLRRANDALKKAGLPHL